MKKFGGSKNLGPSGWSLRIRTQKYFHGVAIVRRRKSHIYALLNEQGIWIDNR